MSNPITEDFLEYRDYYGLIQPSPVTTTQNGILWTSESIIVMDDNNALEDCLGELFEALLSCEVESGMFRRSPRNLGDQEAQDDYIGYMAMCSVVGAESEANDVLAYGNRITKFGPLSFYYVYNNIMPGTLLHPTTPEKNAKRPWFERIFTKLFAPEGYRINFSAWLGRMPHVVAHFHWACNKTPPLFAQLYSTFIIWRNSREISQRPDTWMLTWLLVRGRKGRGILGKWVTKKFYDNVAKAFGTEGLKNLHYIGGDHPINKYWKY